MRTDSLQQFIKLHRDLTQEKSSIETRLRQISDALGAIQDVHTTPVPAKTEPIRTGRGRGRAAGGDSLKSHVLEVLQEGPKNKEEILKAVQARGYKFQTRNPSNSLGVILYGKSPKLDRAGGKFSLRGRAGGTGAGSTTAPTSATKSGDKGKRTMSPEARARIAEAQRLRWAKAVKGKSTLSSPVPGNGSVTAASAPGKRQMSPAARKRIAEFARKRWADAKAAGKSTL